MITKEREGGDSSSLFIADTSRNKSPINSPILTAVWEPVIDRVGKTIKFEIFFFEAREIGDKCRESNTRQGNKERIVDGAESRGCHPISR